MSSVSECQKNLLALAEEKGFLTFDDILDAADAFSLSVPEVDILSEAIQLRGVIVYEKAPQEKPATLSDEETLDYSRTDYDALFTEILDLAPQLRTLIRDVKEYPAPQWREIPRLAMQMTEGNLFARDRLIKLSMRNALKIALVMAKQYEFDLEEAISAGFSGLVVAVDRFDPAGFSTFQSYASMWIQQAIQRECNPRWMNYYFPAHYKEKMFRVLQRYEQLTWGGELILDCRMLQQLLSSELEISQEEVYGCLHNVFTQKYGKISYEELVASESSDTPVELPAPVNECDEVLERLSQNELKIAVERVLSTLGNRESNVIKMRNGIGYSAPMTLEEIGASMGVTRERARQIEVKALNKLKHSSRRKKLKVYL